MPEVTVLRVEVVNSSIEDDNSLAPKKESMMGANDTATKLALDSRNDLEDKQITELEKRAWGSGGQEQWFENTIKEADAKNAAKKAARADTRKKLKSGVDTGAKLVTGLATIGTLYADSVRAQYDRAGAGMQAAKMNRAKNTGTTIASIGLAAAVNPATIPFVLAMKAYQLAETNKQEIFEIRKSQFISQIESKNLVKDTVERRF